MKLFSEYRGLRRELYVLFIGRIMTNLGSMIWPMFTLILNRKLGLGATTIATCMMIYSIVCIPMMLLGGKLADRLNKRNIIVVCDLVSIAAFIYCSLVPVSFASITVFSMASLFQSIEGPSYDALVADFTTSFNREKAYSLSYLGTNLGLVLAPTIGGILFNEHLNLAFLINGISISISTILIFCLIKDVHREKDESLHGNYEKEIDDRISAFSYIKGNKVILLFVISSMLSHSIYMMYNYLMPLDMSSVFGDRGSVLYGSVCSLNCFIVICFTALVTKLFRRILDINKMFIGQSLILLGYVVFCALTSRVAMCYFAITVFTFGEIFNTLSASPFLTRRIPASHRGRIISVYSVGCSIFASVMELVIGSLYDGLGSASAWMVVFAMGACLLVILILMKAQDQKAYPVFYKA